MCQNAICSYYRSYISYMSVNRSLLTSLIDRFAGTINMFFCYFVRCLWQIEIKFFRMFFIVQLNFLYRLPKKERNERNEMKRNRKKEGRKEGKEMPPIDAKFKANQHCSDWRIRFNTYYLGRGPTGCLVVSAWVGVTWRRQDTCDSRQ